MGCGRMKKRKLIIIIICLVIMGKLLIIDYNGETIKDPIAGHYHLTKPYNLRTSNILFVGGSGPNNYSTIQYAINAANDYNTIFVYDDQSPYYENLIIEKPIKLIGEHKHTTIIYGNQSKNESVLTIKANGVSIQGFTIRNASPGFSGISVISRYSMIADCCIQHNAGEGIFLCRSTNISIINTRIISNEKGISMENSFDVHIIGNYLESNTKEAILLKDSSKNKIFKNTIYISEPKYVTQDPEGICLDGEFNSVTFNEIYGERIFDVGLRCGTDNNIISNNTFFQTSIIIRSDQNIVEYNTINGAPLVYLVDEKNLNITQKGQIIAFNCENITIKENNFLNIITAIELIDSNSITVENNTFFNNKDAIRIDSSDQITISQNYFQSQNRYCIHVEESTDLLVINNHFFNNSKVIVAINLQKSTILNNEIDENFKGIYLYQSHLNTIMLNQIVRNGEGIYLEKSIRNIIQKNNIYANDIDTFYINAFRNNWKKNFWNDVTIPHIIPGIYYIDRGDYRGAPPPIIIPLLSWDFFPAKNAYHWGG